MAPRSAQNGTAGPSRVADMRVKWMLRWVLDGRFHEAALRNKRGVESPQWADRAILANLQTPSRHISAPRNKAQSRTAWQVNDARQRATPTKGQKAKFPQFCCTFCYTNCNTGLPRAQQEQPLNHMINMTFRTVSPPQHIQTRKSLKDKAWGLLWSLYQASCKEAASLRCRRCHRRTSAVRPAGPQVFKICHSLDA